MKLDAKRVTKSQLLSEAPPTRKHALTAERVKAKGAKLITGLTTFARQVAKADADQAAAIVNDAIEQLIKLLAAHAKATTDAKIAANEQRPLQLAGTVFWPTEIRTRKAA